MNTTEIKKACATLVLTCAKLCHNNNKAYSQSIGDNSQQAWEDAPSWQKESTINKVWFHLENDTTPEKSHENWMNERIKDGWVYGEEKDALKKTHPCIVPYAMLPIEHQIKDVIFSTTVKGFFTP